MDDASRLPGNARSSYILSRRPFRVYAWNRCNLSPIRNCVKYGRLCILHPHWRGWWPGGASCSCRDRDTTPHDETCLHRFQTGQTDSNGGGPLHLRTLLVCTSVVPKSGMQYLVHLTMLCPVLRELSRLLRPPDSGRRHRSATPIQTI